MIVDRLSEHCVHVKCVALCDYSTYVASSGEVARYKAKALVTDNTCTLLEGLLIVLVYMYVVTKVHTAACLISNQTTPY